MRDYNILFICKHNVFRSQIAEAYFNDINPYPNIRASSGGLFKHYELEDHQIEAAKKLGVFYEGRVSKNLSTFDLKGSDLIVIVANNIPRDIIDSNFYDGSIEVWEAVDAVLENRDKTEDTIGFIKEKVENLVARLEKKRR